MADLQTLLSKFLDDLYGGLGINFPIASVTVGTAGIAVTSTDGVVIQNTTASTAGVPVQQPARFRFLGHVWNETAVAADNTDEWILESVPVSGATPSSLLKFGSSLNGAATTYPGTLSSGLTPTFTITNATAAGSAILAAINSGSGNSRARMSIYGTGGTAGFDFDSFNSGFAGTYAGINLSALDRLLSQNATGFMVSGSQIYLATADTLRFTLNGSGQLSGGATATIVVPAYYVGTGNGVLAISGTAPTIASGFGTTPSVVASNGTAAFTVNVGTGGTATAGVITMPAATTGWIANVKNLTALLGNAADVHTVQIASSTTSITVENQTISTGAAVAWAASDILQISAMGY